ncbi:ABC transporter ATP-binding protein [Erysipelothrix sp. HDW6B]|uniref:ATP-binding cassette domain-containing protein n=1 Tax=Erysipelothrix TaxID=1647 RepID=UPI001358A0E1|nr:MULTISPECIES: ABC transporter ATP-binding protein [Erysipelothrix]QIK86967.1 ABC transporter ATP-binding protein [Erysipelothrix sp. HDW6B]
MNQPFLSMRNVSKQYGSYPVLRGINLELDGGKIIGLCGPNGSGKTTMIKSIMGLLRDFDGEILVQGNEIGAISKAKISYLPDVEYLEPTLTGINAAKLYKDIYPDFDMAVLEDLFLKLKLDPTMPVSKMSKGMREKFQLALCLSRKADIYIFDEPIAGVDPASRDSILDTILGNYANDALLIIATHLIADIEPVLDEVVFLKEGQIHLHRNCDDLREEYNASVNDVFREVFKW